MSSPITDPIVEPWTFAPDPRSVFGPIVSAFEVEHALAQCVRRWQRDYIAEVCRQRAMKAEQLPRYRSIVSSADIEKMPEDTPPVLIIASPGIAAGVAHPISTRGDGTYNARFALDCASHVSARGNRQALKLARLYAAMLRTLVVQQALEPAGGLQLSAVEPVNERFERLRSDADRTISASVVSFVVDVVAISNRLAGPLEPTLPPTEPGEPPEPMEDPEIVRHQITVDKQED